MRILIDNGHGADTQGKRSPDGSFREYRWARDIAARVVKELRGRGYEAELLVPEERDIPLSERCRRVNALCTQVGKADVLLVSVHVNAAGNGNGWMTARGWSAHVSLNAGAQSKKLARALVASAEEEGLKVRRYSPQEPYWAQNLAICRDTACAAVLTENLFMDNRDDLAMLNSTEGMEAVVALHVRGIVDYIEGKR
ncbi:N-acetylmuramoyl-L-alanine amidase [Alistipes sp.]|uniref:N-acetylmuramoyl-L-alanine amidase n=1 Tax=Alistipes sp. TaxID=1872444 RepID=UPI0025C6D67A|nr:N-acetylmuramoyl-L-alanine amidase [Alistipes sp.]